MKNNQHYFGVNNTVTNTETQKYIKMDGITYTCDNPSDINILIKIIESINLKRCIEKWNTGYNREDNADNTVPVKYCLYNYDPNKG